MKFKQSIYSFLFFIFAHHFCEAAQFNWISESDSALISKEYHWQKSGFIDEKAWNYLSPYLLPSNHPIKFELDQIFSKFRATSCSLTMKMAGFENLEEWKWDKVYVAKHPKLKGYLVKAYLDDHLFMNDHTLVNRIIGADILREGIQVFGYQSFFKVPHKWLYQLPDYPESLPGLNQKNFILIVEDMNIVSKKKNIEMYRSLSEEKLLPLFHMINSFGLVDSIYIKNIPFSRDGKIAFVDLERHHLWPISFEKLARMLRSSVQEYWLNIIQNEEKLE